MNIKARLMIAAPLAVLLAGCGGHNVLESPGDSQFGEANRQTMMAQVVNPDPYYDESLSTSGELAADAIERYRNDDVKEPESIRTTNVGGGSGGSGGNSN